MFSELVDQAVRSAGRPEAVADIVFSMNAAIKGIHKHSDWDDDTFEESLTVPSDTRTAVWTPSIGRRHLRRIEYIEDGCGCHPLMVRPSERLSKMKHDPFYYASGESYVFANVCNPVRIYGFRYSRPFQYYPVNDRPARYDFDTLEWNTTDETLIERVSCWILERHMEVVLEGALAHFYRTKQDPRNQLHYAAYKEGLVNMVSAESSRELLERR